MEDARAMARSSKSGRVGRLLSANNSSASVMASEGADGTPVVGAAGPTAPTSSVKGAKPRARMDRPARARGGRVKGKTNITVIVAPQGSGQGGADPLSAAMGAKMGAMAAGGPGNGPGSQPQGGAAMPPPAPPRAPPQMPQQPPMAGQPVPMRKRGGRVAKAIDGAGSGLGRIADAKAEKAFLRANGGAAKPERQEKPQGTSLKAEIAKIKPAAEPKPRKSKPVDDQGSFGFRRGGAPARKDGGPCWEGYKAVGTKKQGKRTVPDCRPA